MAELNHNFIKGRMNKDLDERLVSNGEYRDALNIEVSTSEGANVGAAQTSMGNKKVGIGFGTCVASITDEKNDDIYWLVAGGTTNGDLNIFGDQYSGAGTDAILKYISDGPGTDNEMVVHKFAEEAMYKFIAYSVLSTSISGQQLVPRFKKEKFAAIRQAKLRLSNIKIEELTQIMRGKSKWIKS